MNIDDVKAEQAFREFMLALGIDLGRPGLEETPARVVRAYKELLSPPPFSPTKFLNDGNYESLVTVSHIPFHSLCEHHLLPFIGEAHICYLPNGHILGLSKLGRFVEQHARDLQVQERMTTQIANSIEDALHPRAVGVILVAEHTCMSLRGLKKVGAKTTTTVLRGDLLTNPSLKEEFMSAISMA